MKKSKNNSEVSVSKTGIGCEVNQNSVNNSNTLITDEIRKNMKIEIKVKLNNVRYNLVNVKNTYMVFETIINQIVDYIHIIYLDESFGNNKKFIKRIVNDENIIGKTMVDKIEKDIISELTKLKLTKHKNDFSIESIDFDVINVKKM